MGGHRCPVIRQHVEREASVHFFVLKQRGLYDFPLKKLLVTVVFTDSKIAKRFVGVIIAPAYFSALH